MTTILFFKKIKINFNYIKLICAIFTLLNFSFALLPAPLTKPLFTRFLEFSFVCYKYFFFCVFLLFILSVIGFCFDWFADSPPLDPNVLNN